MWNAGTQASADELDRAVDAESRERTWLKLHEEIVSVGKQIVALEARVVDLLFEADETRLYKRMGFTSIYPYIERVLGCSRHAANERIRVGHELLELPGIGEQFRAGELPWSSVRELTRVVTWKTEQAWLDAIEDKTATDVQQMVRGKTKGALPTDPVDPTKLTYRIVLEGVSAEAYAMHKQARIAVANAASGSSNTDDDFVRAYASAVLSPPAPADEPTRPPYQIAVTTCRECKKGHVVGAGIVEELTPQALERVQCDHEHIGDLESEELTRLASEIPAPTRRKVFVRDKFQCAVPDCRSCRFLAIHHIIPRSEGGGHQLWQLLLLCDGHHKMLHDGVLSIRGRAPDQLVFDLPLDDDEN